MKKFENILAEYEKTQAEIFQKVKVANFDVNDIARKFDTSVPTAYSKLNGNRALLHSEYVILADLTRTDKATFKSYEEYLTNFSKFIEENKIFRQDYFLKIIRKDNIGLKKRFKTPLLWKPDEIKAILIELKSNLANSPISEIISE